MKLKQSTLLAIYGVILLIIPAILWFLSNLKLLAYFNQETETIYWYFKYVNLISVLGYILLLPFFITLYKSQK